MQFTGTGYAGENGFHAITPVIFQDERSPAGCNKAIGSPCPSILRAVSQPNAAIDVERNAVGRTRP